MHSAILESYVSFSSFLKNFYTQTSIYAHWKSHALSRYTVGPIKIEKSWNQLYGSSEKLLNICLNFSNNKLYILEIIMNRKTFSLPELWDFEGRRIWVYLNLYYHKLKCLRLSVEGTVWGNILPNNEKNFNYSNIFRVTIIVFDIFHSEVLFIDFNFCNLRINSYIQIDFL